jgi:hypothetical protein
MRTLHVPASGSWSFPPQSPPATWVPGADGGNVYLFAQTNGCSPDGEGVIFTVVIDGGAPYNSACMENGVDVVPIPPGTVSIEITEVKGCNAGPDTTDTQVWGLS